MLVLVESKRYKQKDFEVAVRPLHFAFEMAYCDGKSIGSIPASQRGD